MIADFMVKLGTREDDVWKNDRPYCKNCGGARFWESPDKQMLVRMLCSCQAEKVEEMEKERKKNNYLERFKELKKVDILKEKYENSYFGNLDLERPKDFTDAVLILKQYTINFLKGRKNNVFIYGDVGRGKTELCACIYNTVKSKQVPVVFTSFMEIIKYITSSFNDDDLENRSIFENLLVNINLLIIDDLGVEYMKSENSFASEIIYNIVNGRYIRNNPTIYTSNDSLHNLKYQARVIDRIAESKIKIKLTQGETYRKEKFLKD